MVQTSYIQKPSSREFRPIDGGKRILAHPVRTETGIYGAQYLEGINKLEQFIEANANLKYFIPSSPDMHALYSKLGPEQIFWVGTGTIVLRRDRNGYADERVTDPKGERLKLSSTSIAHHGTHWKTNGTGSITVVEPGELLPYTELDQLAKSGIYRVAGYDEKRGVVTNFNPEDKPVDTYNNAPVWVNTNLLIVPLGRGCWGLDFRGRLFDSGLDGGAEDPDWRFPLGSVARADSKQLVAEELVSFGGKLDAILKQPMENVPSYVESLKRELAELERELQSE